MAIIRAENRISLCFLFFIRCIYSPLNGACVIRRRCKMSHRAYSLIVGTLMVSLAIPAQLRAEDPQIGAVIKRVYSALVRIRVVTAEPQSGRMDKFQAAGSGFIITPEGHVVTNHHVVGNATHILCDLADRQTVEGDLVATDPLSD